MKTIADPRVLAGTLVRAECLSLTSPRRWGKMNVQQMVTHVAGGMEIVLGGGSFGMGAVSPLAAAGLKFLALTLPLPWPKGAPNPRDPASVQVAEAAFEDARRRVLEGLRAMAAWQKGPETPVHPAFGQLSTQEWQRWAYRHADHHLKQFSA